MNGVCDCRVERVETNDNLSGVEGYYVMLVS